MVLQQRRQADLHGYVKGSTKPLFGFYHAIQWDFLRGLRVADDVFSGTDCLPLQCCRYTQPTRDVIATSMQSRVRICLQTADTAGHLELLGTASTDPNLLHTDVHTPPETIWTLPRMICSYSRPVQGMTASILQ